MMMDAHWFPSTLGFCTEIQRFLHSELISDKLDGQGEEFPAGMSPEGHCKYADFCSIVSVDVERSFSLCRNNILSDR